MGETPRKDDTGAMTEESIPDPTQPVEPPEAEGSVETDAPLPPPPPTGVPVQPRLLRRSSSDRVISGVAGGLGNYFGVDPVIVRIAFLVLALFGGSGVMLYLIGWLVIAKEGRDESRAVQSLRGSPEGNRGGLFLVLAIIGVLIIITPLVWWPGFGFGNGLALPLLLVAAGVALFVWPADGLDLHGRWHDEHRDEMRAARSEMSDARRETRDSWRETRREWRHGYRRGFVDDNTTPAPPPPPPAPPSPPPEPRPKAFLGPLTLAAMLLFTGGAVFADRVDWIDLDPAVFLASLLVIIGVALVLSAFLGRARGLIVLGVMILPIAWTVNAVDLTWWDGIGEETHTVNSLSELEEEYRYGIGEFIIDLSDLDLEGESRDLAVGLTIGEAIVYVPEGMHVRVDLDGRMGELRVDEGSISRIDDGLDIAITTEIGDPDGGTLNLDFDLGIGSGRVEVCSTGSSTTGVPQCP